MKDDQEKNHTEEEQSLGASFLGSDFVQLKNKNILLMLIWWYVYRLIQYKAFAYPYPEEPDAHVANASHGGHYKVHGDDCDQDVVQWKNL